VTRLSFQIFKKVKTFAVSIQLSTSSQIGFIVNVAGMSQEQMEAKFECVNRLSGGAAIVVPFFYDYLLVVVASTNGGNTLEAFVKQVASWAHSLFRHPLRSAATEGGGLLGGVQLRRGLSRLEIKPIFFPERARTGGDERGGGAAVEGGHQCRGLPTSHLPAG